MSEGAGWADAPGFCRCARSIENFCRIKMVVARTSGMDLASVLKRNTFLILEVRPAGVSARDGGTREGPRIHWFSLLFHWFSLLFQCIFDFTAGGVRFPSSCTEMAQEQSDASYESTRRMTGYVLVPLTERIRSARVRSARVRFGRSRCETIRVESFLFEGDSFREDSVCIGSVRTESFRNMSLRTDFTAWSPP